MESMTRNRVPSRREAALPLVSMICSPTVSWKAKEDSPAAYMASEKAMKNTTDSRIL